MPSSVYVTGGQISMIGMLEPGLIRPDGDLSIAIIAFNYELDGVRSKFDGAINQSLTDEEWNYVFLDFDGSLNINTTGFPTTTHIRLGKVHTHDGGIVAIDDERVILAAAIDKNLGYDSAEAQDSTTSTDWQQKLRVTKDLEDGTYIVMWYCELRHSNNDAAERAEMRVTVNDTTEIGYSVWPYNLFEDSGGFGVNVFTEGTYNFDLDYRQQGGGTAYIRRARLFIRRIA